VASFVEILHTSTETQCHATYVLTDGRWMDTRWQMDNGCMGNQFL